MKRILTEILLTCVIFLILDAVWIVLIMKDHFNKVVDNIQRSPMEPNLVAALLCYIFLIGGLYYFVINKVKTFEFLEILKLSLPFGAAVYGTYDFTTATIFKGWDFGTAFMDLGWGMFLSTVTSAAVVYYRMQCCINEYREENTSRDS
jgi:uncharacterized membrane protein